MLGKGNLASSDLLEQKVGVSSGADKSNSKEPSQNSGSGSSSLHGGKGTIELLDVVESVASRGVGVSGILDSLFTASRFFVQSFTSFKDLISIIVIISLSTVVVVSVVLSIVLSVVLSIVVILLFLAGEEAVVGEKRLAGETVSVVLFEAAL